MSQASIEYYSAIGAMVTPVLLLALGALGWSIRHRLERRFALENMLREDRISTYNEILEPFVILMTSDTAWAVDPAGRKKNKLQTATEKMLSLDYRRRAQQLALVAPDAVVRAYNNLMQDAYRKAEGADDTGSNLELVELIGGFLLEIRKSMGNEATRLNSWDMLEGCLKDIRQLRQEASV